MDRNWERSTWPAYRDTRRTALMAIEEVLGGVEVASSASARAGEVAASGGATAYQTGPSLPTVVPAMVPPATPRTRTTGSPWVRRTRRPRRTRRARRRPLLVALTLGLALCIGALFGSGAFNSEDRYNAELVAAQQTEAVVYEVPEVQGHPGAVPTRERSGSIREFLGMASAF